MRQLCSEGTEVVSLGMVALAGLDAGDHRRRHPFLTAILRVCSRTMGWMYNFDGLYRFRNKMKPLAWERVYIVSSGPVSFWTIRAVLMAFAQGWIPRFAVRVLGHWTRQWLRRRTISSSLGRKDKKFIEVPIVVLALACISATVAAVAGAYQGWLPWWASLVLGFVASFAGFTPVHEAVHANVSQWKALNSLVGHACSLLLTGAFRPYCFLHREHHQHTNLPTEDPDYWCGLGPRWSLPLRWLTQDIGYLRYYFSRWSVRPVLERADLLLCSGIYIGLAMGSLMLNQAFCYALLLVLCQH